MAFPRSRPAKWIASFCALAAGLSALPEASATQHYLWPWTGFYQGAVLVALLAVTALFFAPNATFGKGSRSNSVGVAVVLLAFAASTVFSRFADLAGFGLLAPTAGIAAGIAACRCVAGAADPVRSARLLMQFTGALALAVYLRSGLLWVTDTLLPRMHAANAVQTLSGFPVLPVELAALPNTHPFGHANYAAGAVVLTLPVVLGLAFVEPNRWRRAIWAAGAAVGTVALLLTGSRAGIGMLCLLPPVACALVLDYRQVSRTRLLGGFAALSAAALAGALMQPGIRATFSNLLAGLELGTSDSARLDLLKTGMRLGLEHPLTGNGFATISLLYPEHWDGSGALANAFQLHSTPLQIFADAGALGLGACVLLFTSLLATWRRLHRRAVAAGNAALFATAAALGTSLCAYAVFCLTDFQFDVCYFSVTVGVLGGSLAGLNNFGQREDPSKHPGNSGRWRLRGTQIGLLAFALFFLWHQGRSWQARRSYHRALGEAASGNPTGFAQSCRSAIDWAPTDPFYRNQLGWHLALEKERAATPGESSRFLAEAVSAWEASLELAEAQEFCHTNLGWLLLSADPAQALGHFRRAAEIHPGKRGVYFGLALALRKAGRDRESLRALALEALSQPEFATWALWDDSNFEAVTETVTSELRALYAYAENRLAAQPRALAQLRSGKEVSAWWWGFDPTASSAETPFPWPALTGIPGSIDADRLRHNPALATPAAFCYLAASDRSSARSHLRSALAVSGTVQLADSELDALAGFFAATPGTFRDLLYRARASGPLAHRILRNTRPAFGLLARNVEPPIPGDLFLYEQPVLLRLALGPVFPKAGYLPGTVIKECLREMFRKDLEERDDQMQETELHVPPPDRDAR